MIIPIARPSKPSIQLIAFINPTNQKTVKNKLKELKIIIYKGSLINNVSCKELTRIPSYQANIDRAT